MRAHPRQSLLEAFRIREVVAPLEAAPLFDDERELTCRFVGSYFDAKHVAAPHEEETDHRGGRSRKHQAGGGLRHSLRPDYGFAGVSAIERKYSAYSTLVPGRRRYLPELRSDPATPAAYNAAVKRSTLLFMQVAGAVTLLAYPGVLIASIMALGGHSGTAPGLGTAVAAVLLVGSLLYPVIWGVLWFSSWRAFKNGRPKLAALLSAPPLLVLAAFAGLMMAGSVYEGWRGRGYLPNQAKEFERVERINPLLAAAMRYENWELEYSDFDAAIRRADKEQLSRVVQLRRVCNPPLTTAPRGPDGPPEPVFSRTPLGFMLECSVFGPVSPDSYPAGTRPHYVDFARLMVARGATLAPEEINDNAEIKRRLQAIMESPESARPRTATPPITP